MTTGSQPAPTESHLTIYSMGIAAENLTIGSKELHITPIEKLTFVDGELKSNPVADTVTGTDATGATSQTKATTNNAITATWFPFHSNRQSPPDIRRGERVIVWRFSDLDTFLWTELGLDQKYRKLETVTYAFNATQDESDDTTTAKNCYYVEVSTHKGTITLQTSKANNEKTAHTVQFNPMAGQFTFADDLGQVVYIDSVNHLIHMANADKSSVTLDKQDITIACTDTLTMNATNAVNITTKEYTLNATDVNINATGNVVVKAENLTANVTTQVKVEAPTIILGSFTLTASQATLTVPLQCAGINSSEDVNAPNI